MEDFKEYYTTAAFDSTSVHPIGLALVVLFALVMLLAPRRHSLLPVILVTCTVPISQRVAIAGFDVDFPRMIILTGWVRILVRGEIRRTGWNALDTAVVVFTLVTATIFSLGNGTTAAVTNRAGWLLDTLAGYLLFRQLLAGNADPRALARQVAIVGSIVAAFFALEYVTQRNVFSVLGGVASQTWVRSGNVRCQGPFAHAIIAGVYFAVLLPLMVSLWAQRPPWRKWAVLGSGAILLIVYTTGSSTPLMALVFGLAALAMYPLRRDMAPIRWGVLAVLLLLHFVVMQKPVWHLVARIAVLGGSTGYHRAAVMDEGVDRFGEWWLFGSADVSHWRMQDITNEFVLIGIHGGILALACFVWVLVQAYRRIGQRRQQAEGDPRTCFLMWALGCGLFAHTMTFFVLSYFAQVRIAWYLYLAVIASVTVAPASLRAVERRPGPRSLAGAVR